MRIALVSPRRYPIPPRNYGGVERIVHAILCAAQKEGHHVTLFAHPDSQVDCELIPYGWDSRGNERGLLRRSAALWPRMLSRQVDVAHTFTFRFLPVLPYVARVPLVRSFQLPIQGTAKLSMASLIARDRLVYTACSQSCAQPARHIGNWRIIYNCVPIERYRFVENPGEGAYLAFLGRFDRYKGAHNAIEVARRTGLRLKMAGILGFTRESAAYFSEEIAPHIDGDTIQYVGVVDDERKNRLLGGARAFLMPIEWEEPFGIVMAEALACGTPVVGLRRGSVPEVVRQGLTGYVCSSVEEMVHCVQRVGEIQRSACREDVEMRFSERVITRQYLDLYAEMCQRSR